MHTGKLNMLRYGIKLDLAILSHCIHLYLLGLLNEFRHNYGVFLRYVGRKLEETCELVFV